LKQRSCALQGELVRIGILQGHVIAVKMRNDHIRSVSQPVYDDSAHIFSCRDLNGMRKQALPLVTESYTRIDQDPAVGRPDPAGKTANPEGLSS
jgi:hypothetical protein